LILAGAHMNHWRNQKVGWWLMALSVQICHIIGWNFTAFVERSAREKDIIFLSQINKQ